MKRVGCQQVGGRFACSWNCRLSRKRPGSVGRQMFRNFTEPFRMGEVALAENVDSFERGPRCHGSQIGVRTGGVEARVNVQVRAEFHVNSRKGQLC